MTTPKPPPASTSAPATPATSATSGSGASSLGMETLVLERMPTFSSMYARVVPQIVTKRWSRPSHRTPPALVVRGIPVNLGHLEAFRRVVDAPGSAAALPPTYPHVMVGALHGALIAHADFPYRALGMVHVRNRIRSFEPLRADAELDATVWLGASRAVRKGTEFDIHTQMHRGGALVWEQTTSVLQRERQPKRTSPNSAGKNAAAEAIPKLDAIQQTWDIGAAAGRAYAAVSGDYNPIHLYPWTAKLFGFSRPIATGMWTLAKCAAALSPVFESGQYTLEVSFRRPVALPSAVRFCASGVESPPVQFRVEALDGAYSYLTGSLELVARSRRH